MSSTKNLFPLNKILVSTDGSENANRALDAALTLAKQNESELVIVNVVSETVPTQYSPIGINTPTVNYDDYFKAIEQAGGRIVDQAVKKAESKGVKVKGEVLRAMSSTVESIVNASNEEHVDLIVMGTRGLGGFKKLVLGSVSSGVVSHAHCSVMIVR